MNFNKYHVSKNLFDKTAEYTVGMTTYNYTISGLDPNKYYTCSTNFERISGVNTASLYFDGGSSVINGVWSNTPRTFKPNSNGEIIVYIRYSGDAGAPPIIDDVMAGTIWVMVNESSTPQPYEPYSSEVWHDTPHYIHNTSTDTITTLPAVLYPNAVTATVGLKGNMEQSSQPSPTTPIQPSECGDLETSGAKAGQYKIPILSASTTTPVYLGEVETTRQIQKLVLDGTENWSLIDTDVVYVTPTVAMAKQSMAICSHYTFLNVPRGELTLNSFTTRGGAGTSLWFKTQYTSTADFKTFLQQEYANGTPVCVWYVLATETTGIVNEPIRKIGDYADTVSGISIPTITGADSFDVLTTQKPSEVELTYTGWHDATVQEWDGSQWNE